MTRAVDEQGPPAAVPPPPRNADAGWTGGRIVTLVIGALLTLSSIGLLGAGGTASWAALAHRDDAGYVTTGTHTFSTVGSAITTDSIELGDPGIEWLYSTVVLGEVRIRVTPGDPGSRLFVGIGRTADVDRYLAGVTQTVISDFWTDTLETTGGGGTPASSPDTQGFWVASATGTGPQTLTWDPENGSWTVVVMNADAEEGISVEADMGARMPLLTPIAIASLVLGGLLLLGGVALIVGAVRRSRDGRARAA